MSTDNKTKINQLLTSQPTGIVFQSQWLKSIGYSGDLQKRYRSSNWFKSIGSGAMVRNGENISYEGAIYSLQKQSSLFIHPGGRTALALLGKSHYLELSEKKAILFGGADEKMPAWFRNYNWGLSIEYYPTSFLLRASF